MLRPISRERSPVPRQRPHDGDEAAAVILDGVREEQCRILVGDDAHAVDAAVRAQPELAYEGDAFVEVMRVAGTNMPEPVIDAQKQ